MKTNSITGDPIGRDPIGRTLWEMATYRSDRAGQFEVSENKV